MDDNISPEMEIILAQARAVANNAVREQITDVATILNAQLAVMQDQVVVMRNGLAEVKNEIANLYTIFSAWMPDLLKKYRFTITDTITEINESNMPTMPWISVSMDNTGADPVHMYINEYGVPTSEVPGAINTDSAIPAGGGLGADMLDSTIKKVFLVCDPGETTTVELFVTCKFYKNGSRK